MSAPVKVLVVGASGRTGETIVNGLLTSPTKFDVTILTRESSLDKPNIQSFKSRGVKVATTEILGPREDLVNTLKGIDVVVSAIYFNNLKDQVQLASAAKEAGVSRFVPSNFATPAPRGVLQLYDWKDDVLAGIQRAGMPWTVIDVGWWSEQILPELPSGRTDAYRVKILATTPGDGTTPVAITHRPDIGKYVARIITDPRTLNRKVFAYTEVVTISGAADLVSELSGEEAIRSYLPAQKIEQAIAEAKEGRAKEPENFEHTLKLLINEYFYSWGIRGDSAPEPAKIFGYLDFKELYPDASGVTLKELVTSICKESTKA